MITINDYRCVKNIPKPLGENTTTPYLPATTHYIKSWGVTTPTKLKEVLLNLWIVKLVRWSLNKLHPTIKP